MENPVLHTALQVNQRQLTALIKRIGGGINKFMQEQPIGFRRVKDLQKPVYVMYVTVCPPAGLYFCSALINTSA